MRFATNYTLPCRYFYEGVMLSDFKTVTIVLGSVDLR